MQYYLDSHPPSRAPHQGMSDEPEAMLQAGLHHDFRLVACIQKRSGFLQSEAPVPENSILCRFPPLYFICHPPWLNSRREFFTRQSVTAAPAAALLITGQIPLPSTRHLLHPGTRRRRSCGNLHSEYLPYATENSSMRQPHSSQSCNSVPDSPRTSGRC